MCLCMRNGDRDFGTKQTSCSRLLLYLKQHLISTIFPFSKKPMEKALRCSPRAMSAFLSSLKKKKTASPKRRRLKTSGSEAVISHSTRYKRRTKLNTPTRRPTHASPIRGRAPPLRNAAVSLPPINPTQQQQQLLRL